MAKFSSYVEHHSGAFVLVGLAGSVVVPVANHFFGEFPDWLLWGVFVVALVMLTIGLFGMVPRKPKVSLSKKSETAPPAPEAPKSTPLSELPRVRIEGIALISADPSPNVANTGIHVGQGGNLSTDDVSVSGFGRGIVHEGHGNLDLKRTDINQLGPAYQNAGRNDPCPCGSGKKFKKCHGEGR